MRHRDIATWKKAMIGMLVSEAENNWKQRRGQERYMPIGFRGSMALLTSSFWTYSHQTVRQYISVSFCLLGFWLFGSTGV
jgi:hypothetical protein